MTADEIPVELKSFLRERIQSYDDLELLTLFHSTASRSWRIDAVARQLNITHSTASEALENLRNNGLLALVGEGEGSAYRYSPSTPELARLATQLIDLFENERLALVKSMNENAVARMRSGVRRMLLESLSGKGKAAS
jgi:DNA-binding IclR family transcriptional regulator